MPLRHAYLRAVEVAVVAVSLKNSGAQALVDVLGAAYVSMIFS